MQRESSSVAAGKKLLFRISKRPAAPTYLLLLDLLDADLTGLIQSHNCSNIKSSVSPCDHLILILDT